MISAFGFGMSSRRQWSTTSYDDAGRPDRRRNSNKFRKALGASEMMTPGFLEHLARQRTFDSFRQAFDPTAGEVPARAVSMADEKHARRMIDDDALDAESSTRSARARWAERIRFSKAVIPFQVRTAMMPVARSRAEHPLRRQRLKVPASSHRANRSPSSRLPAM